MAGKDELPHPDEASAESAEGEPREPSSQPRCHSSGMHSIGAEMEFAEAPPRTSRNSRASREAEASFRPAQDPDAALVARWQGGDANAFEHLVRRHERTIFRLLYRMLGSREEAEDAAQEAFLSLHRHGRRFRREARFSTFLYRVAANAGLNRRRSLGRSRARERELALRQAAGTDLPTSPRDPEAAARGTEAQARVQAALMELPEELRVAVVLYDIEGQSYRDIAEILEIPEGTVKSRIHRARQGLRDLLEEFVRNRPTGEQP